MFLYIVILYPKISPGPVWEHFFATSSKTSLRTNYIDACTAGYKPLGCHQTNAGSTTHHPRNESFDIEESVLSEILRRCHGTSNTFVSSFKDRREKDILLISILRWSHRHFSTGPLYIYAIQFFYEIIGATNIEVSPLQGIILGRRRWLRCVRWCNYLHAWDHTNAKAKLNCWGWLTLDN